MNPVAIDGGNFSGRSALLLTRAKGLGRANRTLDGYYLGPSREGALSGLSSVVREELALYGLRKRCLGGDVWPIADVMPLRDRKLNSLSGGEQILVSIGCLAASGARNAFVDTALEQLDGYNRLKALDFFVSYCAHGNEAIIIDNRLRDSHVSALFDWVIPPSLGTVAGFALSLDDLASLTPSVRAPSVVLRGIRFTYNWGSRPILNNVNLDLEPATIYRLHGPNGSGKTTFLKLLAGVERPQRGSLRVDGKRYDPYRRGNSLIAISSQHPDYQWCGTSLQEDLERRYRALNRGTARADPVGFTSLLKVAALFGMAGGLQRPLHDLPLAQRKRLSWLWPFAGMLPWLALDEPTIGQDAETRTALARHMSVLSSKGFGILFVSHDDDFASMVEHKVIVFGDQQMGLAAF